MMDCESSAQFASPSPLSDLLTNNGQNVWFAIPLGWLIDIGQLTCLIDFQMRLHSAADISSVLLGSSGQIWWSLLTDSQGGRLCASLA